MRSNTGGWDALRRQSETLRRKVRDLLHEAESRGGAGGQAIRATQELSRELAAWEAEAVDLGARLSGLVRQLEPQARLQAEHFQEQLTREITHRGQSVYGESSPLIVDGIVHVHIDLAKLRVTVNDVSVPE